MSRVASCTFFFFFSSSLLQEVAGRGVRSLREIRPSTLTITHRENSSNGYASALPKPDSPVQSNSNSFLSIVGEYISVIDSNREAVALVIKSKYLMCICGYAFCQALISSMFYFQVSYASQPASKQSNKQGVTFGLSVVV